MTFRAKAYINDMHEMSFFITQLNKHEINPSVHGRYISIHLEGENLERIQMVLATFDSLKDKDGKNEFSFTLEQPFKERPVRRPP